MDERELLEYLARLILEHQDNEKLTRRNEKLKRVLLLLAKGAVLTTVVFAPGTAKVFRKIKLGPSEFDEWKIFNRSYLEQTIRKLESKKLVEVNKDENGGKLILTQKGRRKILQYGIDTIEISKPSHWDGKWRMVFYDVFDNKKYIREKFRHALKSAGFYPLQKSVYLHAYPCEKEIAFLKYFLGISGEVRMIVAERIENDREFRHYFGV